MSCLRIRSSSGRSGISAQAGISHPCLRIGLRRTFKRGHTNSQKYDFLPLTTYTQHVMFEILLMNLLSICQQMMHIASVHCRVCLKLDVVRLFLLNIDIDECLRILPMPTVLCGMRTQYNGGYIAVHFGRTAFYFRVLLLGMHISNREKHLF